MSHILIPGFSNFHEAVISTGFLKLVSSHFFFLLFLKLPRERTENNCCHNYWNCLHSYIICQVSFCLKIILYTSNSPSINKPCCWQHTIEIAKKQPYCYCFMSLWYHNSFPSRNRLQKVSNMTHKSIQQPRGDTFAQICKGPAVPVGQMPACMLFFSTSV